MQRSNGSIYNKPQLATKSQNEQPKTFACFGSEIELIFCFENKNEQRRAAKATNGSKWKHAPKNKTSNNVQQKATKSIFYSHFHSFASILDLKEGG